MNLKDYLRERQKRVEGFINDYLGRQKEDADCPPAGLHEAMAYSLTAGGKRVRPILAIAGYEAMGGQMDNVILPAACAFEFIHTYSLIHDDLPAMDNDDFRRGKPTNHKVFGEAAAILAGDGLLTDAFGLIASVPAQADRVVRVVYELARAAGSYGMVGGQQADIDSEGKVIDGKALQFIHEHKTAALISVSVRIGVILGGGSDEAVAATGRYGKNIGLVFQIVDDLLDVTGSIEELGKTPGADIARGKNTYPSIFGLEASEKMAEALVDEAVAALAVFGDKAEPLRELARYILKRRN